MAERHRGPDAGLARIDRAAVFRCQPAEVQTSISKSLSRARQPGDWNGTPAPFMVEPRVGRFHRESTQRDFGKAASGRS